MTSKVITAKKKNGTWATELKIEKGIEIPKQSRSGVLQPLVKSMQVGDSVFFYEASHASYFATCLRDMGCKATTRQERTEDGELKGYRVWKKA